MSRWYLRQPLDQPDVYEYSKTYACLHSFHREYIKIKTIRTLYPSYSDIICLFFSLKKLADDLVAHTDTPTSASFSLSYVSYLNDRNTIIHQGDGVGEKHEAKRIRQRIRCKTIHVNPEAVNTSKPSSAFPCQIHAFDVGIHSVFLFYLRMNSGDCMIVQRLGASETGFKGRISL